MVTEITICQHCVAALLNKVATSHLILVVSAADIP